MFDSAWSQVMMPRAGSNLREAGKKRNFRRKHLIDRTSRQASTSQRPA